jgi:hypothetical protein
MAKKLQNYLNNKNLKSVGVDIEFTPKEIDEYIKCSKDPIYFIKTYVKVVHVDRGTVPFALYGYQERIINDYHENRKVIVLAPRQMGKTVSTAAYFLWLILFNDDKNIAILANKAAVAREILSRIQFAYECLPKFISQGVKEWNKGSIKLENGSSIITAATSPNAIRGFSCTHLYIDEISFIPKNIAEEFITSVFPTISSGDTTKIFISSTPKGMNIFHKMWLEAIQGISGFVPVRVYWNENPTRNDAWAAEQLKNLGQLKFSQEVSCEFMGSSKSLIAGAKLATIGLIQPKFEKDSLSIYFDPVENHSYVCSVDTSRGQHLDYSAFVIFDITSLPYQVVATYKNNQISPMAYPFFIQQVCQKYNFAYILVEVNDIGGQVSDTLFYEFEYENIYFTYKNEISEGAGYPGIRTTKKVKSIGCSTLKDLIEEDQLLINSYYILQELNVFVQKGASYAADDEEINDDLIACCFLFAYLTKQQLFTDLTSTNIRSILAQKTEQYISDSVIPFGCIANGKNNEISEFEMVQSGMSSVDKWIFSDLPTEE